jgi:hypothetical protein
MHKTFISYFIPLFLGVYFIVALLPVFAYGGGEIFPFFSFKLYSKIPDGFVRYDLLLNEGEPDESFLILGNSSLNPLEKRNYPYRLGIAGSQPLESLDAYFAENPDLLKKGRSVAFVKLSGKSIDAVRDKVFEVETIKQLK